MVLHIFSEKITYQGITKLCTGSCVINSMHTYHYVSCFSLAVITYSQQINLFFTFPMSVMKTQVERGGKKERNTFLIFCGFFIMLICKKGEVTTPVTTWGAVQKHPWAVSTGETSWQK